MTLQRRDAGETKTVSAQKSILLNNNAAFQPCSRLELMGFISCLSPQLKVNIKVCVETVKTRLDGVIAAKRNPILSHYIIVVI